MADVNTTQVEHVSYRMIGEQILIYGTTSSDSTPNTSIRVRDNKKKNEMLNSMISLGSKWVMLGVNTCPSVMEINRFRWQRVFPLILALSYKQSYKNVSTCNCHKDTYFCYFTRDVYVLLCLWKMTKHSWLRVTARRILLCYPSEKMVYIIN